MNTLILPQVNGGDKYTNIETLTTLANADTAN
jgi:hypothetical protein